MPKCVIKVCRNYHGRLKATHSVTYHRIPTDPVIKARWVNIIRRSRGDELWHPLKTSVICSDHFREKDIYYVQSKKRRRLKKEAIPSKALYLSSQKSDDSDEENRLSDEEEIHRRKALTKSSMKTDESENSDENNESGNSDENKGLPSKVLSTIAGQSYESDNFDENMELSSKKSLAPAQDSSAASEDVNPFISVKNKDENFGNSSELDSTFNTPKKPKLQKHLRKKILIQKRHILKIQSLRRKNLRLTKNIASFKQILQTLKKERYIDNNTHTILKDNVFAADLYASMKKKMQRKSKRPGSNKYKPEFRKFCITLHFLSPQAYSYVRKKFETCLPHPKTISNWYCNIDGSPGLTAEAFKMLAEKRKQCDKNMICALIADEMAIKQQRCFNQKTKQEEGLVDIGTGPNGNMNIKASEVYVLMLVSLNEPWKLPVAYFLIHGMSGEQKANTIKTVLIKCHDVGVDIVSLTFDGHTSNLSAMQILGCKFDDPKNLKTTFKHPCANFEVAVFLDFCHMLKLVRNHFELKGIFLYKDEEIMYDYVKKLEELQEEIGLHLANRLTKKHVQFRNSVMNVKLATRLLSRSVSKAIEFCRKELKFSDFVDSKATEKFIMVMNNAFDVFNSRNFQACGYKRPLCPENKEDTFAALDEAKDFILNLTLKVSRKRTYKESQVTKKIITKTLTPVLKTQSFTGFLGVLICINSLKALYKALIDSNIMAYLNTYRISQDHLELLFGAIRLHGGYNNNPNARQFKGIYRKFLCHMELKSAGSGNWVPLENISILTCSSALNCINQTTPQLRKDDEDDDDDGSENVDENVSVHKKGGNVSQLLDDSQLAKYTQQIVGYIAGCVVRCLSRQIKCTACIESLLSDEKQDYHKLVSTRDEGGLIYASRDVFSICKTAEAVIRNFLKQKLIISKSNYTKMLSSVMKKFIGDANAYFKVDSEHACGLLHQVHLIRLVAEKYLNIRCYITKLDNMQNEASSKRNLYNKKTQREGH